MPSDPRSAFQTALERFGMCLETPRVPGELEGWIAAVKESAVGLAPLLRRQIDNVHAAEYAKIVENDAELFRRVAQLKEADKKVGKLFDSLMSRIDDLALRIPQLGPNEAVVHDEVKDLVKDGLAFLIEVQQQELAVRTWLQEAFNRDRGVGD